MNHYPKHVGDYLKKTAHLSMLEDGCYNRMLDVYYTREKPLPPDDAAVCRLVRANSKDERRAVVMLLKEFFSMGDKGWHNKRADIEIAKYQAKAEANRSNGKAGGRPNKTQEKPSGFLVGSDSLTQNNLNQNQEPEPIPKEALPEFEISAATAMAVELRRKGLKVNGAHPTLQAWCNDGFSLPAVLEAYAIARMRKPEPEEIGPNYLDPILRNPPKKAEPAWWSSDQRILAKGSELGLNARPGEEMSQFKERIQTEIGKRKVPA